MMPFVLRLGALIVVVLAAMVVVRVVERRGSVSLVPGGTLTLLTGTGCRLCEPAERALQSYGATFASVDVAGDHPFPRYRSLPVAIVTDANGTVLMRRSGRSVIDDAADLAAALAATPV